MRSQIDKEGTMSRILDYFTHFTNYVRDHGKGIGTLYGSIKNACCRRKPTPSCCIKTEIGPLLTKTEIEPLLAKTEASTISRIPTGVIRYLGKHKNQRLEVLLKNQDCTELLLEEDEPYVEDIHHYNNQMNIKHKVLQMKKTIDPLSAKLTKELFQLLGFSNGRWFTEFEKRCLEADRTGVFNFTDFYNIDIEVNNYMIPKFDLQIHDGHSGKNKPIKNRGDLISKKFSQLFERRFPNLKKLSLGWESRKLVNSIENSTIEEFSISKASHLGNKNRVSFNSAKLEERFPNLKILSLHQVKLETIDNNDTDKSTFFIKHKNLEKLNIWDARSKVKSITIEAPITHLKMQDNLSLFEITFKKFNTCQYIDISRSFGLEKITGLETLKDLKEFVAPNTKIQTQIAFSKEFWQLRHLHLITICCPDALKEEIKDFINSLFPHSLDEPVLFRQLNSNNYQFNLSEVKN